MQISNLSNEKLIEYYNLYKKGIDKTKRFEQQKINNCDLKFLYHVVRLVTECQQILDEYDLDLERNREELKAIRRGEWTLDQLKKWFSEKEKILEKSYSESKIPQNPDEKVIKSLLLNCLEQHFGNLDNAIHIDGRYEAALREIYNICRKSGI